MMKTIQLLLPALVPAWNFFDSIGPSPRIHYQLLDGQSKPVSDWCEYHPRPQHVSFGKMLRRMVWNPRWNETLFLVSCAERLLAEPTAHSEHEIFKRIARTLLQQPEPLPREQQLRFRIVLLYREGSELIEETAYESGMVAMTALQETVTTA